MRSKILFLLLFTIVFNTRIAFPFCSEPSAPFGGVPSAPYCGSYGDLSNCEQWEIDNYKSEIEDYINELQEYANDAIEYANCQQEEARDAWNQFVRGY